MKIQIADALAEWGVVHLPASQSMRNLVETFFGDWAYAEDVLSAVPAKHSALSSDGNVVLYLWQEKTIVENHLRCQSRDFLQVGTLLDGGTLALDTTEAQFIGIGSLSVGNCGNSNWTILRPDLFRKFPFSYQRYLMEMHRRPDVQYLCN